jgi:hypothetical protein
MKNIDNLIGTQYVFKTKKNLPSDYEKKSILVLP